MRNRDQQKEMEGSAKRRGFTVLFFSVFPLLMPSLLYATILLVTDLESLRSVGAKTDYAEIIFPQSDKVVSKKYLAKGVIQKIPDDHFAYLSSSSDDLFWPKIKITEGEWSLNMTAAGDPGYKYNLSIITLPKGDHQIIEKWFQEGRTTGKYPPIKRPKNLKVLATVKVVK